MNLLEQLEEVRTLKLEAIAKWDSLMRNSVSYERADFEGRKGILLGLIAGYSYTESILVKLLEECGG